MSRPTLLSTLLLLALASAGAPARAADDKATIEAREHVQKAKVHFKLGEFDHAIAEWKEAYRLKAVPLLLFNIGQANRMAGNYKESKFYYENFLNDMPTAPNRDEVEKQLAQLKALLAEEEANDPKNAGKQAEPVLPTPIVVARPLPEPPKPAAKPEPVKTVTAVKPEPAKPALALRPEPARPTITAPPPPAANDFLPPEVLNANSAPAVDAGPPSKLPLILGVVAGALAVGGAVTYGLARSEWSAVAGTEHPRAEVDQAIASSDAKYKASLGLAGAAAAVGLAAGLTFVF
jgi:tetratricopeptide (TPR) repeat protein